MAENRQFKMWFEDEPQNEVNRVELDVPADGDDSNLAFKAYAVSLILSTYKSCLDLQVYKLSTLHLSHDVKATPIGPKDSYSESINVNMGANKPVDVDVLESIIHRLLSKARNLLRTEKHNGRLSTFPVFYDTSSRSDPTKASQVDFIEKAVKKAIRSYYGNGYRFRMYIRKVGVYDGSPRQEMRTAFLPKSSRIVVVAGLGNQRKVYFYQLFSIPNKDAYFNVPHRIYWAVTGQGFVTDMNIAASKKCERYIVPTNSNFGLPAGVEILNHDIKLLESESGRHIAVSLSAKSVRFGVIMDAGSSGTRAFVYEWSERFFPNGRAVVPSKDLQGLKTLPYLEGQGSGIKEYQGVKIDGGISKVLPNAESVKTYLDKLFISIKTKLQDVLHVDEASITEKMLSDIPVYLLATGGMRSLKQDHYATYVELRKEITSYLNQTDYLEPTYDTVSGEQEGIYGWVAGNWDEGVFNGYNFNGGPRVYMEIGGQTTQIAFLSTDIKYRGRLLHLKLGPYDCDVFTKSWPELGANAMWEQHKAQLRKREDFKDPCWPRVLKHEICGHLAGTADIAQCIKAVVDILPCTDSGCRAGDRCAADQGRGGCLLYGMPKLNGDENFIGASVFFFTMLGIYAQEDVPYDMIDFWATAKREFDQPWATLEASREAGATMHLPRAFFNAGLVIAILHWGFGVPMSPFIDAIGDVNWETNSAPQGLPPQETADKFAHKIAELISVSTNSGTFKVIASHLRGSPVSPGHLEAAQAEKPDLIEALTQFRNNCIPHHGLQSGWIQPTLEFIKRAKGPKPSFMAKQVSWTLGRMVLRASYCEPEERINSPVRARMALMV